MVPIDADGSHENNDENRLLLKFIALFQLLNCYNSTSHFWACQATEISGFKEERCIQTNVASAYLFVRIIQSTLRSIERATSARSRAAPLLN